MAATTTISAEAQVREFAREYPLPNVLRGVSLCESGRISWDDFYVVCCNALADGIAAGERMTAGRS